MAAQHASLSPQRWAEFPRHQQILMIANEWHRAGQLLAAAEVERRRSSCARVLRLVDLTVAVQSAPGLRRELLRWRDLAAELYLAEGDADPLAHRAAAACLRRLDAQASRLLAE
jgi:hypothetical protein